MRVNGQLDATPTVLQQYANSPRLRALIDDFNEWIDPEIDVEAFYDYVWNVETAQGFGLDVWGKIVDVKRTLAVTTALSYLGFKEATSGVVATNPQPFGQAPMWNGSPQTQIYALGDDAYRRLIRVKALANITDCTAPNLNRLLQLLFEGEGKCYVVDVGSMAMRFVFEFPLSPVESSIMLNSNAVPRPAGVLAQVMVVDPSTTFGFQGSGLQPFGSGTFYPDSGIQNAQ